MKRTSMESLQTEESNDMQKCTVVYKMATCSRMLNPADILVLLDQQEELKNALTTDLDANEDLSEGDCDGEDRHWYNKRR